MHASKLVLNALCSVTNSREQDIYAKTDTQKHSYLLNDPWVHLRPVLRLAHLPEFKTFNSWLNDICVANKMDKLVILGFLFVVNPIRFWWQLSGDIYTKVKKCIQSWGQIEDFLFTFAKISPLSGHHNRIHHKRNPRITSLSFLFATHNISHLIAN